MSIYKRGEINQSGRINNLESIKVDSAIPKGIVGDKINNIFALTQANYDSIVNPDPKTLYVIKG